MKTLNAGGLKAAQDVLQILPQGRFTGHRHRLPRLSSETIRRSPGSSAQESGSAIEVLDPLPLAPPKLFSTQPDPVIPAHSPVSDRWLVGKAPHCRPLPRSLVRISNTIGPPKAEALTRLPLSFGSSGDERPSASESDGILTGYWYGAALR